MGRLIRKFSDQKGVENYAHFKQQVEKDCNGANKELQNEFNKHTKKYAKKLKERCVHKKPSFDACLQASKNYVIEECAALIQPVKLNADFLTYPGNMNPCAKQVYTKYASHFTTLKYARYAVDMKPVQTVQTQSQAITSAANDIWPVLYRPHAFFQAEPQKVEQIVVPDTNALQNFTHVTLFSRAPDGICHRKAFLRATF